jgi:hypothetical protein
MIAPKRQAGSRPGLNDDATRLTIAIRADGRHDHVTVRAERAHLYVDVDEEPIVRLEPLASDQYGLSFHHHTGRWERTPFTGDVGRLAEVITTVFAPHLESYAFPPTKSGLDH